MIVRPAWAGPQPQRPLYGAGRGGSPAHFAVRPHGVRPPLVAASPRAALPIVRPQAVPAQPASARESHGNLVAEAQRRLLACKADPESAAAVARLIDEHQLNEKAQLALRFLAPSQLMELLAGEDDLRQKLSEVPDKNDLIVSVAVVLDPEVEGLIKGLVALDEQQSAEEQAPAQAQSAPAAAAGAAPTAGAGPGGAADLVTKAQARLKAYCTEKGAEQIKGFVMANCLAEEVELALRLLSPEHLQEVMAAGLELKRKLLQNPPGAERNAMMRKIISMLDPEVEALLQGLLNLEGGAGGEAEEEEEEGEDDDGEWDEGEWDEWEEEGGWSEGQAQGQAQGKGQSQVKGEGKGEGASNGKGKEAPAAATPQPAVLLQAQARLQAHGTNSLVVARVRKLKQDCGLSDEAELALRLLSPAAVGELFAGEDALRAKLREVPDGSQMVITVSAMLDPQVDVLLRGLRELEGVGTPAPAKPVTPPGSLPLWGGVAGKGVQGQLAKPLWAGKGTQVPIFQGGVGGPKTVPPPKQWAVAQVLGNADHEDWKNKKWEKTGSWSSWDESQDGKWKSWSSDGGSGKWEKDGDGWKSKSDGSWQEKDGGKGSRKGKGKGKGKKKGRRERRGGGYVEEEKDGKTGANIIEVQWTPPPKEEDPKEKAAAEEARSRSPVVSRGPAGRGRVSTLPAWMTAAKETAAEGGPGPLPAAGGGRPL